MPRETKGWCERQVPLVIRTVNSGKDCLGRLWNIHHSWFLKANVTDVSRNHPGIAGPALGKDCEQVYSSRQSTRATFLILGDNVPDRQRRLIFNIFFKVSRKDRR